MSKNLIPVWLREGTVLWDADEKEYLVVLGIGNNKTIRFRGKGE